MGFTIEAAAGCSRGRIRGNNEDNLYFAGRILEQDHDGLQHPLSQTFLLDKEIGFCVFDGMGGEEAGEVASYLSAQTMGKCFEMPHDTAVSPREFLFDVCIQMNQEVCDRTEALEAGRMGSTMVSFLFTESEVYVCNIGDSRAFRLRDDEWMVLSHDHVELPPVGLRAKHKPRLTQHLGIFPDELTLEPYIAKGDLREGDQYLLCSDGLTDMLTNIEICSTLKSCDDVKLGVKKLIEQAVENGGRDNITVILCRIK